MGLGVGLGVFGRTQPGKVGFPSHGSGELKTLEPAASKQGHQLKYLTLPLSVLGQTEPTWTEYVFEVPEHPA